MKRKLFYFYDDNEIKHFAAWTLVYLLLLFFLRSMEKLCTIYTDPLFKTAPLSYRTCVHIFCESCFTEHTIGLSNFNKIKEWKERNFLFCFDAERITTFPCNISFRTEKRKRSLDMSYMAVCVYSLSVFHASPS